MVPPDPLPRIKAGSVGADYNSTDVSVKDSTIFQEYGIGDLPEVLGVKTYGEEKPNEPEQPAEFSPKRIKFISRNGVKGAQVYVPASTMHTFAEHRPEWFSVQRSRGDGSRNRPITNSDWESCGKGVRSTPVVVTFTLPGEDTQYEIASEVRQTRSDRGLSHSFLNITNVDVNMLWDGPEDTADVLVERIRIEPLTKEHLQNGINVCVRVHRKQGRIEIPNWFGRMCEALSVRKQSEWSTHTLQIGRREYLQGSRRPKKVIPANWDEFSPPEVPDMVVLPLPNSTSVYVTDDGRGEGEQNLPSGLHLLLRMTPSEIPEVN